ncbi:MAG: hypothetical protein NC090_05775 [Anaeroplasma bactoclasticum]|nr:hypothetical protein [Anaeroplasma bactoclasticum]MCM1514479.1 hypothetical protein [Anaeroplasma bactoclasticum]
MNKSKNEAKHSFVKPLVPNFAENNPEGYKTTYQNKGINEAFRINTKKDTPDKDAPAFQRKYSNEAVNMLMKKIETQFTSQTVQHIVYSFTKLFEQSNHEEDTPVQFTLKEYKADFGKKDSKSAARTLRKVFNDMNDITINYTGGDPNNPYNQSFGAPHPIAAVYKNGKATIEFIPSFRKLLLSGAMMMYIHPLYFKLNPYRETVAQSILYEMAVNKRTNASNKSRQDHMSIKSLLPKIHSLPSYDEVMNSDKHITLRIIDPFNKALERLANPEDGAFTNYYILDKDNKPLDYEHLTYEHFINSYLYIEWKGYPEEVLQTVGEKKKAVKKKATKKKDKNK